MNFKGQKRVFYSFSNGNPCKIHIIDLKKTRSIISFDKIILISGEGCISRQNLGFLKIIMQGKLIAVAYTLRTY